MSEKPNTSTESDALSRVHPPPAGSDWKYVRPRKGVSKWIKDDRHWVTKFDDERFCVLGIHGAVVDVKIEDPKDARNWIEGWLAADAALSPNDKDETRHEED